MTGPAGAATHQAKVVDQTIRVRVLGYGVIVLVGCMMAALLTMRYQGDMAKAVQHFRQIQLAKTKYDADRIETAFTHLHENLKTISFIPGIRAIDRHAAGVSTTTLTVVSQLYLNLALDLDISEIYVVPVDFDPEHVDMVTHRTDEPIMSFDGLIGRSIGSQAKITPHIPGDKPDEDDDPNQGDETQEYILLKEQLQWLKRNAPQLEQGFETNVPMISGREVITCDNSEYKTTRNDADRNGMVFSVPFYDTDGALKGTISAIIRTNSLRKLLPADAMLVNKGYGVNLMGPVENLKPSSFEYARKLQLDPDLIYSTLQPIDSDDAVGHWVLWDGESNKTFETSADRQSALLSYAEGMAIVILLSISAVMVWALIQRTIDLKAANEHDLLRKVEERTRDFEQLLEETMRAEAEAEVAKREALREANALLEEFIAHAPAAIAMFDCNLNYIAHTRRWATQHHADGHSFVGRHQYDVLPQMGSAWDDIYQNCLAGQIERRDSDPFLHDDGSVQWLTWEIRPWRAQDGSVRGLIMMTEDITARKAIEGELQKALLKAESAARAKADFLANMSHELRTPLSGIIGTADIILADDGEALSAEHRKLVELQRTSGADLLSIVNDILDFSKADAGNLRLETIPVTLDDLISSCLATVGPNADRKQLTIERTIGDDVPSAILGDPTRLKQVLLNLLSNAVKFTPDNGTVRVAISKSGPDRLRFAVSDTGIGIPEDKIGSLFTRFSQADTSISRHFGGTGLGLAICRQFVELMKGTIDVTSKPGAGSTFFFDIPALAAEETRKTIAVQATTSGIIGHSVLVAEDNATNRLLISKMLQKYGCKVTLVTNGVEAVDALTDPAGHDFDIVLMDIQMPELDGQEASRLVRSFEAAHPHIARVPIVALTANGFPEEVAGYLAAGMDMHLIKPIDWPKLMTTIDTLALDRSPTHSMAGLADRPAAGSVTPQASASVAEASTEADAIDQTTVDELRETLGAETAQEIIGMFADELDDRLARMASGAPGQAAAEAHALASAAKSIGCIELSALCKDMERRVRDGETDIAPQLAAILKAAARAGKAIDNMKKTA